MRTPFPIPRFCHPTSVHARPSPIDAAVMGPSLISQTLDFLRNLETYCGLRLWRSRKPGERRCVHIVQTLLFFFICLLYCSTFVAFGFQLVPIPGVLEIKFNVYVIYVLISIAVTLDALVSFLSVNFGTYYLFDQCDYNGQSLKSASIVEPPGEAAKWWRIKAILFIIFFALHFLGGITQIILAAFDGRPQPYDGVGLGYWLSLPNWVVRICFGIVQALVGAHLKVHCVFILNHYNLLRLLFRAYCKRLKKETGESFTPNQLLVHHNEYYRLTNMAADLNSTFHVSFGVRLAVTVFSVLLLSVLYSGGNAEGAVELAAAVLMLVIGCLVTLAPIFMLRAQVWLWACARNGHKNPGDRNMMMSGLFQVREPNELLRGWLAKHLLYCVDSGKKPDKV